ncbi:MAG: NAD(P)-dependent oxidoreductase [Phycisphaerales bacterium]|jgi:nucleoside-diphosphate-sugar epimerase|nr:NAD(P)-dependent oxidoreductase [Phycisphaerales bacterium]
MLVALTGASGFIGSYTAAALAGAGHRVRALVRPTSHRGHIEHFVSEWQLGDQDDPQTQAALVAGAEVVIHNAADWSALEQSPANHFRRNVMGSLGLLEATRAAGAEQFIFVSSVAVYHQILPDRPLDENHPTWPSGVYGAYKASIEPFLKAYHVEYGLNTSAWRPAAVYGIDPDIKRSQWYELIQSARNGGQIDTDKGGKITHVQDVADALCLAVGDPGVAGQFYNLVDRYMYWQSAAEFAKEISGSSAQIENRKGTGPKNNFDTKKAIEFFNRHHNTIALRRGLEGVREYVGELLTKIQ